MARLKHKYNVYLRKHIFAEYDVAGLPNETRLEIFAGSTWAVSERQAVNNVRVRNDHDVKGHNWDIDERSMWFYKAFRIDEDSPFEHDGYERIRQDERNIENI